MGFHDHRPAAGGLAALRLIEDRADLLVVEGAVFHQPRGDELLRVEAAKTGIGQAHGRARAQVIAIKVAGATGTAALQDHKAALAVELADGLQPLRYLRYTHLHRARAVLQRFKRRQAGQTGALETLVVDAPANHRAVVADVNAGNVHLRRLHQLIGRRPGREARAVRQAHPGDGHELAVLIGHEIQGAVVGPAEVAEVGIALVRGQQLHLAALPVQQRDAVVHIAQRLGNQQIPAIGAEGARAEDGVLLGHQPRFAHRLAVAADFLHIDVKEALVALVAGVADIAAVPGPVAHVVPDRRVDGQLGQARAVRTDRIDLGPFVAAGRHAHDHQVRVVIAEVAKGDRIGAIGDLARETAIDGHQPLLRGTGPGGAEGQPLAVGGEAPAAVALDAQVAHQGRVGRGHRGIGLPRCNAGGGRRCTAGRSLGKRALGQQAEAEYCQQHSGDTDLDSNLAHGPIIEGAGSWNTRGPARQGGESLPSWPRPAVRGLGAPA